MRGDFVSRDATVVTILRSDRKTVTIPLDKLHPDDRTWLNSNHPLPASEAPPESAVFDHLAFGDKRARVLEKLKASKFVEAILDETFFARTGLNGVFRIRLARCLPRGGSIRGHRPLHHRGHQARPHPRVRRRIRQPKPLKTSPEVRHSIHG